MKGLFTSLLVLLVIAFIMVGCTNQVQTTQTPAPTSTPASPAASSSTVPQPGQPQSGGTYRIIVPFYPTNLGYPPGLTPNDYLIASLALEQLLGWGEKGTYTPALAESYDLDQVNKTLTFHLRKNVKFTDGSDFNASVVKWNFEQQIAAHSLRSANSIDSIELVDAYTLRLHLNAFDRMSIPNYGCAVNIASQAAFEKAANGDPKAGELWARSHPVGTGAYKVVDFKQGVSLKWERNDNYWRGKPYFDKIEAILIPDSVTGTVMMKSKDADVWNNPGVRDAVTLEKQGLKVNYGVGMGEALLFNSSDPKSIYANQKVREAVEYAINRPALAQTIGFGKYEALTQMVNSKNMGYNPGFDPRPYDVAKARQLLAEAGHPDGFKTKILTQGIDLDVATSIQGYLQAVGIQAELDVADTPRYMTSLFIPGNGWSDLALAAWGINPNNTEILSHFGPNPLSYRTGNIAKSAAYLALCDQALQTHDQAQYVDVLKQIVRQASDDTMVVPLYTTVYPYVMQTYVHSDYPMLSSLAWNIWEEWMDKH